MLTFSLTKALPGDPALNLVGERASPEVIESIRRELRTDKNFFVQYVGYAGLLLKESSAARITRTGKSWMTC